MKEISVIPSQKVLVGYCYCLIVLQYNYIQYTYVFIL